MNDFDEISRRNWEQRRARRRGGTAEQPTAPPPARRLPDDTARPAGSPPEWRRRPLASSPPAEEEPRRSRAAGGNRVVRWFRDGGYLWVGGVLVVLVFVGAFLLLQNRLESGEARNPFAENSTAPSQAEPGVVPTAPLPGAAQQPQPAAPPNSGGGGFVVAGTANEGLFLRDAPSSSSTVLTTLPEGTRVEQIGDDQQADNLTWRNVRAPDGQEGWVAIDWLRPE